MDTSKIKAWTHLGLYHHPKARPLRCLYSEGKAWAECGTDHELVCGKLNMCIKKEGDITGVKVPKRIDVSKLEIS